MPMLAFSAGASPSRAASHLTSRSFRRLAFAVMVLLPRWAPPAFADDARTSAPALVPEDSSWDHHLRVSLGGGYDSNVRLVPLLEQAAGAVAGAPRTGSYASASLFAGVGVRLGAFTAELEYGLVQTAYADPALDGSSFQMHLLEWASELQLARSVRLRLPVHADVSALGFSAGFRPFEWSAGLEPELAVVLGHGLRMKVSGGSAEHHPLDPAFAFLAGVERHASAALDLRVGGWSGSLEARFRDDAFGSTRDSAATASEGCPSCTSSLVTPYAYQAPSLSLRIGAPRSWVVRPAVVASVEGRRYQERLVESTGADGRKSRTALSARRDRRLGLRSSLAVPLGRHWQLTGRYDFVQNVSNLVPGRGQFCSGGAAACLPLWQNDHNYLKHVVGLDLEAEWL
jgi:hypothetical protein